MLNIISQEVPLGRKARRQRANAQKINELSVEIALLRTRLEASENALRVCESETRSQQESLLVQLAASELQCAEMEADQLNRRLEAERLESSNQFLKVQLEQVKLEKELMRLDYERLAAELKAIKVERARNDIEAWRAMGESSTWKRCYHRIEGFFRKDRDDSSSLSLDSLLRLPPPS
jgi:hypothetical protein